VKWRKKKEERPVENAFPLAQHKGHLSAEYQCAKIESVLVQRRVNQLSLLHFYQRSKLKLKLNPNRDRKAKSQMLKRNETKRKAKPIRGKCHWASPNPGLVFHADIQFRLRCRVSVSVSVYLCIFAFDSIRFDYITSSESLKSWERLQQRRSSGSAAPRLRNWYW